MACTCRNALWATFLRPFAARNTFLKPRARLPLRSISYSLPRLSDSADPSTAVPAPAPFSESVPSPPSTSSPEPTTPTTDSKQPIPKSKRSGNKQQKRKRIIQQALQETLSEPPKEKEHWQLQKAALAEKFPMGWSPPKRLSPDCLAGMRALHAQFPDAYDTPALANLFGVSPEAVRRILKSKWTPRNEEEEENRRERWTRRGVRVWERYADLGLKVPGKWRREGVAGRRRKGDRGRAELAADADVVEGRAGGEVLGAPEQQGEKVEDAERAEERKALEKVKARRRVAGKIM